MSAASLAANTIFNLLIRHKVLMVSEGLNIFRVTTHTPWSVRLSERARFGKRPAAPSLPSSAVNKLTLNPDPDLRLAGNDVLILIGTGEAEKLFITQYPEKV